MVQMYAWVESFVASLKSDAEEGQGMVEYALIIALVSVAAIIALTTLGGKLGPLFDSVSGKLNPAG